MSFASPEKSAYGARKPYDEQTLLPVTIKMLLNATPTTNAGGTGQLALSDGREISSVKFVAAVRNAEEQSTHIKYEVEDGTGLIEVKQFIDESTDTTFIREMREKTARDNIYVRVIGQLKDFGESHSVVGFSVRVLSSGNELTHHMLEVVYSGERYKKERGGNFGGSTMTSTPFGTNAPLSSPVPSTSMSNMNAMGSYSQQHQSESGTDSALHNAVLGYIKANDDIEVGADLKQCEQALAPKYSTQDIKRSIDHLSTQGLIYSTIDETKFKYAE